jgi:hypothetical protein
MSLCEQCSSRLQGTQSYCPSCGSYIPKSPNVILEITLPISLKYEAATKVDLYNPSGIKTSSAKLDFHPFYVFDYLLNAERSDPSGKFHILEDEGTHIVDAFDGSLLTENSKKSGNLFRLMFFRKGQEAEDEKIRERDQIIDDLNNIEPIFNLRIIPTGDYIINILREKVSLIFAKSSVIRRVIEENKKEVSYKVRKARGKSAKRKIIITPKKGEVQIGRKRLIYVPIWTISMKSGDFTYVRKVLAPSGTYIKDEIMICPKHSSLNWTKPKRTSAVCEICGLSLCLDHFIKVDQSCYCESHLPNKVTHA